MAVCPTTQTSPVAPLRPALGLILAAALAAPGLSLAAPFLPNPAYLNASTYTDGIRHATNPVEAPVDSPRSRLPWACSRGN